MSFELARSLLCTAVRRRVAPGTPMLGDCDRQPAPRLISATDLAARYAHMALLPVEVLVVIGLDGNGFLRSETHFRGQVAHVAVRPAQALRAVVATGATALALVHNHPSGRSRPSAADVAFTGRMADAARLLGLALVDHIIVASRGWTSLAQRGLLGRSDP